MTNEIDFLARTEAGRKAFLQQFRTPEELAARMRAIRRRQALYTKAGKAVVEAYEKFMNVEAAPMG